MTKALAVVALAFSITSLCYAGPEQYSGKEMKQVAPVPAPECPQWGGFYVGGFGGYTRAVVDPELDLLAGWIGFPTRAAAESAGSRDFGIDGGQAGGLIGFNFVCHRFLLGLEGSGAYVWAGDTHVDHFFVPGSPYRLSTSAETNYLATVGPRIGYTFCRFMPYVTGGAAFGNLDFAQSLTFSGGRVTAEESGHENDTTVGWFVGGGLEYALTNHWHLRGDYKFADLGDVDFKSNFQGGGAPAFSRADLREHSATFGIVYQF